MRKYELIPTNGQKSFYGKAIVCVDDSGEETLYSYGTPVAKREPSGEFVRLWSGYSATTMRHVNSFLQRFGIPGGGKAWWDALPVGE